MTEEVAAPARQAAGVTQGQFWFAVLVLLAGMFVAARYVVVQTSVEICKASCPPIDGATMEAANVTFGCQTMCRREAPGFFDL